MLSYYTYSDEPLYRELVQRLSRFVEVGGDANGLLDLSSELSVLGHDPHRMVIQVLPATIFHSEDDVERIANDLELTPRIGPSNVQSEASGIFYELALNAVQHSQSALGEYAILQCAVGSDGGIIYLVGVADCGIGIPESLRQNPEFAGVQNDHDAIALATGLHITGTGDSERGVGLDYVVSTVKGYGGDFIIVSGQAYWNLKKGTEIESGLLSSTDRLSGTVAAVALSVPPMR